MECYNILNSLAELASKGSNNTYTITDYAFGFIPFKNGENKVQEVGNSFFSIIYWLLKEMEN